MKQQALPIHPTTGLRAVFVSEKTGRVYWPIRGGSGPGDGGAGDGGAGDGGAGAGDAGAADAWTPPADADEFNRIIEDRLARERKKYGMTPDEAKAAKDRIDALDLDLASDIERATREGTDSGWSAAMQAMVPRIVRAEFKAESVGKMTDEQLDALLEDVDLTKYADDDGDPDTEKIRAKIEKITTGATGPSNHVAKRPTVVNARSLGQGKRPPVATKPGEAGAAMAQKRFGDKVAGAQQ